MIVTDKELMLAIGLGESVSNEDVALMSLLGTMIDSAIKGSDPGLGYNPEFAQRIEILPVGQLYEGERTLNDFDVQGNRMVPVSRWRGASRELQLRYLPVWTTGIEVREDTGANAGMASGAFATATILTAGGDYWADLDEVILDKNGASVSISRSGILHRSSSWPREPRSIKVTYNAGWQQTHFDTGQASDIKLAVLLSAQKLYTDTKLRRRSGTGITSESIGSYSASYAAVKSVIASPDVQQLLQAHKQYG